MKLLRMCLLQFQNQKINKDYLLPFLHGIVILISFFSLNISSINTFIQTLRFANHILAKHFNERINFNKRRFYRHFAFAFLWLPWKLINFYQFWKSTESWLTYFYECVQILEATTNILNIFCIFKVLDIIEAHFAMVNRLIDELTIPLVLLEPFHDVHEKKLKNIIKLHSACDDLIRHFNIVFKWKIFAYFVFSSVVLGSSINLGIREGLNIFAEDILVPVIIFFAAVS